MGELKRVETRMYIREAGALYSATPVRDPEDAVRLVREELLQCDRENLLVVNLDTRLRPISYHVASIGGLSCSVTDVGGIFRTALLQNAAAVLLAHNHPGGDPQPSEEDVRLTKRMIKAGKLLDVQVIEHIIIGDTDYSMRQEMPGLWK